MIYAIQKIPHLKLISRGCSRVSIKKEEAVNLEIAKPGAVLCQKWGAVPVVAYPEHPESVFYFCGSSYKHGPLDRRRFVTEYTRPFTGYGPLSG